MMTFPIAPPPETTMTRVEPFAATFAVKRDALVSVPDAWEKCYAALDEIGNLQDDWDDDGAIAPAPDLTRSVQELVAELRPRGVPAPSRLGAGPNGTVLLEWQNGPKYFEIEVCEPYHVEWMMALPGLRTQHGSALDASAFSHLRWTLS
jgi:hypothetical protein